MSYPTADDLMKADKPVTDDTSFVTNIQLVSSTQWSQINTTNHQSLVRPWIASRCCGWEINVRHLGDGSVVFDKGKNHLL